MTISDHKYGVVWYRLFQPVIPSTKYVVCLHGSGEWGAPDGTELNKLYNTTCYPKLAGNGFEFPFNIIAPQALKPPTGSIAADYAKLKPVLSAIVAQYNPTKVVITGYSQGGEISGGYLTDSLNGGQTVSGYVGSSIFDAYVIVAGRAPGIPQYCVHSDKPVYMVHGTLDTSVPVGNATKLRDQLNLCPDRTIDKRVIWDPIVGGNHSDSWNKAYSMNDLLGKRVYDFITSIFAETATPVVLTDIRFAGDKVYATGDDAKTYTWPAIQIVE